MIVKRNFNPIRVIGYVKSELAFSIVLSTLVYLLYAEGWTKISIPFSITAILGSALAIFIAFRNNNAYARWWEARTQWGNIVNATRVLARLVITFTDSHSHQANYDAERSRSFKREMIYLVIAWSHALRLQLRKQDHWQELKPYLNDQEFTKMIEAQNKVNSLQLLAGQKIYKAMADGTLGGFDSFQMEGQMLALANAHGACERIKNTPLLRQYHYFTKLFLYAFMLLLPFSLVADFAKLEIGIVMIPVSVLIAFVFSILGKVGEVNEDPFENRITDVPLNDLCNTIEHDLLEMLGEGALPKKQESRNGFLF